jgi:hypothetical protein
MTEAVARALAAKITQENTHVDAEARQRRMQNGTIRKTWSVQLTLKNRHQLTKEIESIRTWSSLQNAWNVLMEVHA